MIYVAIVEPLEPADCSDMHLYSRSFVIHWPFPSRSSCNSEESASELQENIEKCFLGTTWTVILSACSNLQSHTGVLPVAK